MNENLDLWRCFTGCKFKKLLSVQPAYEDWEKCPYFRRGKSLYCPERWQGSLWFAYPHAFRDDLEGTFQRWNDSDEEFCTRILEHFPSAPSEAQEKRKHFLSLKPENVRRGIKMMAQLCGVSCWHANEKENARMWGEYAPNGCGYAIRTTTGHLVTSLLDHRAPWKKAHPTWHRIDYVDHKECFLPYDGCRYLLGIKDAKQFQHENEMRVIAKSPLLTKMPLRVVQEQICTF